jgi:predicted CopG family antitoxin
MSTKTITITLDAYKRLRSKKASNESFTDIILKLTRKQDTLAYIRSMKKGNDIGDFNLLIASIALTHGEPLLTKNAKHFSRVPGLAVETY